MAAGCVVLGDAYTADVAEAHTARGEAFRGELAAVLARHRLPVSVTGYGSSMTIHALPAADDGAEGRGATPSCRSCSSSASTSAGSTRRRAG